MILGKTNLSEWANIRSNRSMSGWSAVGGLVRNPYALDRTACGSSSGSGAAVAASFAAAAVGTETDGSVICPSSINGLVGLKPTLGLVSRTHVVPISHSQDTPGPMARSVRDAAILLSAMAAADPADPATAGRCVRDYAAGLSTSALSGLRVGGAAAGDDAPDLAARFEAALGGAARGGRDAGRGEAARSSTGWARPSSTVLKTELKADLDAYLATTPASVTTRTLDRVIAFNRANAAAEMPYFAQETFEDAAKTKGLDDPAYKAARAKSLRLAGAEGIDAMLKAANATVLVQPTYGAAWLSDPVHGDQYGGPSASELPAVAGYPNLTVPMGLVERTARGAVVRRDQGAAMRRCSGRAMPMSSGHRRGSRPTYRARRTAGACAVAAREARLPEHQQRDDDRLHAEPEQVPGRGHAHREQRHAARQPADDDQPAEQAEPRAPALDAGMHDRKPRPVAKKMPEM